MFKADNMRVLLVISMVLYLLCSSVNMVLARSFLDAITNNYKRQIECPFTQQSCESDSECANLPLCPSKLKTK